MTGPADSCALVWFRRDLRDFDHAALHHALATGRDVYCVFVFDTEILDALPSREDRRVEFIRESVVELDRALRARRGGLIVRRGRARDEIPRLAVELRAHAVFANHDYEPAARERDAGVAHTLRGQGIAWHPFKDQVIFECDEIRAQGGGPFRVFTPYKNAWLRTLAPRDLESHRTNAGPGRLVPPPGGADEGVPTLATIGFERTNLSALNVTPGRRFAIQ